MWRQVALLETSTRAASQKTRKHRRAARKPPFVWRRGLRATASTRGPTPLSRTTAAISKLVTVVIAGSHCIERATQHMSLTVNNEADLLFTWRLGLTPKLFSAGARAKLTAKSAPTSQLVVRCHSNQATTSPTQVNKGGPLTTCLCESDRTGTNLCLPVCVCVCVCVC